MNGGASAGYVGLDLGGTHVRTARWRAGDPEPAFEATEPRPEGYPAMLDALGARVGPGARGVGLGLPGRVEDGRAVWVPNVPDLDGRSVARDLSERVGAPVALGNDAHLALLGEARFGAARGVRDAILVVFGTGIGGAVMWNGRIVPGAHGTTGAFGWLGLPPQATSGAEPPDPQRGPWERRASGTALTARARALRPSLEATSLPAAAREGHAGAAALLDAYARDVGTGLASLASIFDPERILISGGVAALIADLLPEVRAVMEERASPASRATELRLAEHADRAGALGAAALAREGKGAFLA